MFQPIKRNHRILPSLDQRRQGNKRQLQLTSSVLKKAKKKTVVKPSSQNLVRAIKKIKFFVGPGNNREIIQRIMRLRGEWDQVQSLTETHCFRWQQTTKGMNFQRLQGKRQKIVYNHFEFHQELTTKHNLLKNLQKYYVAHRLNSLDRIPVTFVLNLSLDCQQLNAFLDFYLRFMPNKRFTNQERKIKIVQFKRSAGLKASYEKQEIDNLFLHKAFKSDDCYLWIFKPAELNRGRGIKIFSTLQELLSILMQIDRKKTDFQESKTFIIQKYLERPLLIEGRKFDIRMWGLVTHNQRFYCFSQGYVRTACQVYNKNSRSEFTHLTNNAIQKKSNMYGRFEQGNQMSLDDLSDYCNQNSIRISKQSLMNKIKKLMLESFQSVKDLINKNMRKYSFQIFGFDFLVGEDGSVWLVEVNTNPCLEESSQLLRLLLGPMIDQAFVLTIDKIFGLSREQQPNPYKFQWIPLGKQPRLNSEGFTM